MNQTVAREGESEVPTGEGEPYCESKEQEKQRSKSQAITKKLSYTRMAEQAVEEVLTRLVRLSLELVVFDIRLIIDQIIFCCEQSYIMKLLPFGKSFFLPLIIFVLRVFVVDIPMICMTLIGKLTWFIVSWYIWLFFLPLRIVETILETIITIALGVVDMFKGKGKHGEGELKEVHRGIYM